MLTFGPVLVLLAHVFCLGGIRALEWSATPDEHMHTCSGSTVTFPWNFEVAENETIVSVNWIHDGEESSAVVATMVRDHFMATSAFAGRVRRADGSNGGLVMEGMTVEDSGNYTLEVQVTTGSKFDSLKSIVNLQVADDLMLKGRQLLMAQDPDAWWDQSSRQWFVRLTCGPFTFLGQPSVDVAWTTPDGKTLSSSGYESGHFYLSLVTPVKGGDYTCTIPPASLPGLCYRKDGGQGGPMVFSSRVTVDETSARMSMLEANQKTLLQDGSQLRDKLKTMRHIHEQDVLNVTQLCQVLVVDMESQIERVHNERLSLEDKVRTLYTRSGLMDHWDIPVPVPVTEDDLEVPMTTVVPLRYREGPCQESEHSILDDDWRSINVGEIDLECDNDLEHGWYRFVLNGKNAVMPRHCVPKNHCNTHAPMWLDLQGKNLPEVGQEVEGRACANWDDDCCNWQSPVTVLSCGDYFVYRLQPGSDCHLAFCMEPQ